MSIIRRLVGQVPYTARAQVRIQLPRDNYYRGLLLSGEFSQSSSGGTTNGTGFDSNAAASFQRLRLVKNGSEVMQDLRGVDAHNVMRYFIRDALSQTNLTSELPVPNRTLQTMIGLDFVTYGLPNPNATVFNPLDVTLLELVIDFSDPQTDLYFGGDRVRTQTGTVYVFSEELLVDVPRVPLQQPNLRAFKTRYLSRSVLTKSNVPVNSQDQLRLPVPQVPIVRVFYARYNMDGKQPHNALTSVVNSASHTVRFLQDQRVPVLNDPTFVGRYRKTLDAWRSGRFGIGGAFTPQETSTWECIDLLEATGAPWLPKPGTELVWDVIDDSTTEQLIVIWEHLR